MRMDKGELVRGVLVHHYRGEISDAEYDVVLDEMARALRAARVEGRKIALLAVAGGDSAMSSKQRSRTAAWLTDNTALMRAGATCQAVVVPSAVQRGVLTAILWMIEYPVPIRAFSSQADAEAWARSMLQASDKRSRQAS